MAKGFDPTCIKQEVNPVQRDWVNYPESDKRTGYGPKTGSISKSRDKFTLMGAVGMARRCMPFLRETDINYDRDELMCDWIYPEHRRQY